MSVNVQSKPAAWLDQFLSVRQRRLWHRQEGPQTPLYRYRCGDEEFALLEQLLRAQGPTLHHAASDELAALFCLYSAEWLRRYHRSGSWTWDGIFKSLELRLRFNDAGLYSLVDRGLRFWRRPLLRLRRRSFLMTLACEGGVPAELVTQDATRFRSFFRLLLNEYRTFGSTTPPSELARRVAAAALPITLQRDMVYELCGELVECVQNLQSLVSGQGDPLIELDTKQPNWRDTLPLQVSEQAAAELLRGLLDDARAPTQRLAVPLRASLRLDVSDGVGKLLQFIRPPTVLETAQLEQLFGRADLTHLGRLTLRLVTPGGERRQLALLTRVRRGEETVYVLESASRYDFILHERGALDEMSIELLTSSGVVASAPLPGGEALSELPWVFVESPGTPDDTPTGWRLLTQGSARTRMGHAVIVVAAGDRVDGEPGAVLELFGTLADQGRRIFRLRGTARIACATGGLCVVSTGEPADAFFEPRFQGRREESGRGSSYYRGIPQVLCRMAGGVERNVARDRLRWRPTRSRQEWRSLSAECVGDVELRCEERGETLWQARLAVLPDEAHIELIPHDGKGRVVLSGTGDIEAGVPPGQEVTAHPLPAPVGSHDFQLLPARGATPSLVRIALRWAQGQHLELKVPFPTRGVRFRGSGGEVLPPDAEVVVDRLGGIQVEVLYPSKMRRPPRLYGNLLEPKGNPDTQVRARFDAPIAGGQQELYTLDLAAVQADTRLLLTGSRDLDSYVELEVILDGATGPRVKRRTLRVKRYEVELKSDYATEEVFLGRGGSDAPPRALSVHALSLLEPTTHAPEMEVLPAIGPGRWRFSPEGRTPGPWLVLGREGEWWCTRPLLLYVGGLRSLAEPSARDPLLQAVPISNRQERLRRLREAITGLAEDAQAPGWQLMGAYLRALGGLPPATLDAVVALSQNPAAAALALFMAPPGSRAALWRGLEEFPFSWSLIPVRVWRAAARRWAACWRSTLEQLNPTEQQHLRQIFEQDLESVAATVALHFRGLEHVFHQLKRDLFPTRTNPALLEPRTAASPAPALNDPRQHFIQEVLNHHAHENESWPQGSDLDQTWRGLRAVLPPPLQQLFIDESTYEPEYYVVLQAPILAALSSAWGCELSTSVVLDLRRAQSFDPEYFQVVYGITSLLALHRIAEISPERLT